MPETNNQPQLLDPDSAFALVQQRVYTPVFFTKLASDYGITANSDDEARRMMSMAAKLRTAHDDGQLKAAGQQFDFLKAAQDHLDEALASEGYDVQSDNDDLVKAAAAEVAVDPEIAHAVLSLQAQAAMAMSQG